MSQGSGATDAILTCKILYNSRHATMHPGVGVFGFRGTSTYVASGLSITREVGGVVLGLYWGYIG